MTTANIAIPTPNSRYAAIFCAIGVLGSFGLILFHVIGEISFVSLIGFCLLGSAIVLFQDRLIKADIKGSIELSQIEQVRDDVISREKNIRSIAILLSEITLFTSEPLAKLAAAKYPTGKLAYSEAIY